MTGRRGNGEGTIFQRKDGRWCGQVYVLLRTGGRARRIVYGRTRDEVSQRVTDLLAKSNHGVPVSTDRTLLGADLEEWLTEMRRSVRPRTYESYEATVRLHIEPMLGKRRMDRVSVADVKALVSAKEHAGLSDNSVRIIHATLRAALDNAVREERLSRNVARLVRRSRPKAASVAPLDVGEARLLLDAARRDRLYALWAVAIGVGLRRGEALGLRWQDVDLEAGTVRVVQSLQRVDAALRMAAPKTSRSRRTVFLPEVCRAALRDHRHRQDEERRAAGTTWQEFGLVFTTRIGTPIDPRNVKRWLDALSDRAGMRRIRIHDLRHTCASVLLAQGVHPRVVMETLGHSQMAVTIDIYSHVMPAVQEEAAREMQKALRPVAVKTAVNRGRRGTDGEGASA